MDAEKKRITRNSLFLYLRTFLIMVVTLYTTRVTLRILGFEDFGIYNAVAGIVVIFAFLSNTLTSVAQRYLAYYIGKNEPPLLNKYFNAILLIYALTAVGVIIAGEALGVWFLNVHLSIPAARLHAANWVFQFALITLFVNFIQIPYNAIVIARERMDVYAYVSILEAGLKLGVVYLLVLVNFDNLILYAFLLFVLALIRFGCFAGYASLKFKETRLKPVFKKDIYEELMSYLGWNTAGVFTTVLNSQSVVIILNIFFGAIVNAAYALAVQVRSAFQQFVTSFTLAVQPQIVKQYAAKDIPKMLDYVYLSSKYSCFLLLIVAIPSLFQMRGLLGMWLGEYPPDTIGFSVIVTIIAIVEALCIPLVTAIQATGNIKNYNIAISGIMILSIPCSVGIVKMGGNPYSVILVAGVMTAVCQGVRVYYMMKLAQMPFAQYMERVFLKIIYVLLVSLPVNALAAYIFGEGFWMMILATATGIILTIVAVWLVGMTKSEKESILNLIRKKISGLPHND